MISTQVLIRPREKICLFPVTRPTLFNTPPPRRTPKLLLTQRGQGIKSVLIKVNQIKNKLAASRQKGGDLTQSYDKSPYTNRNVKRAKRQHKQRHKKKVRLNNDCGPT